MHTSKFSVLSQKFRTDKDSINRGMMQVERNWLNPDGIPGRPWFKHILYGARFTYAHLELPGLTEAVEKQDWPTAKQQAEILQRALANNTELISKLDSSLREQEAASGKSSVILMQPTDRYRTSVGQTAD